MMKNNKKAEFRIQHIVIAVLVMGLFGIYLVNMTNNFVVVHSNGTISEEDLTVSGRQGNMTGFDNVMRNLTNMTSDLVEIGGNAPGGSESTSSADDGSAEGATIKAGFNFIQSLGRWLFIYPAAMLRVVFSFFGLPAVFSTIATTIIWVLIAIALISSILKNRI